MGKTRNLWSQEGGSKAVARPQPVAVAKGWRVEPEVLPVKPAAPRRRVYAPIRPNNRDAVPTPLAGQSYNPADADHQQALAKAVRTLARRKERDEKFVKKMSIGRGLKCNSSLTCDQTWEEEIKERATPLVRRASSTAQSGSAAVQQRQKKRVKNSNKKKKKITAKDAARQAQHSLTHRRHPSRDVAVAEVDELDTLLTQHASREARKAAARDRRRQAKKENRQIKHYGRHYHTPLALDVAPTDRLVGALRQVSGGFVHPIMERMKSLEERNLVPARMRHTYNKRKILKPKGQLRVKRETVGVLPTTDF